MFSKKTIRDVEIKNKIILVRVDYNVPLKDGKVASDLRIRSSLPTINYLIENGAKRIVLISHLGRPEGKRTPETLKDFGMSPVADCLRRLIPDQEIGFYEVKKDKKLKDFTSAKIVLLENLRFDLREESNDRSLIEEIINFVEPDFFVQDGFAVIHRAHASTDAVAKLLPAYSGFLLEKEIKNLEKVTSNPEKPLLLILGGAKVDDKQPLIDKFIDKADKIAVGGKIAADGFKTDDEKIYVAEDFDENAEGEKLDIGPLSSNKIAKMVLESKTVVWNGTLGKTEDPAFATSSTIIAKILGENENITSIICGGDTTGFVENLISEFPNLKYTLVSTGGGASLEFLLGKKLPGLDAIMDK